MSGSIVEDLSRYLVGVVMKYPANYLTDEYSLDSGNALYAECHQVI